MHSVRQWLRLVPRWFKLAHLYVKEAEPWSVLITAVALIWTVVQFRIEREDRRIDDINRALALFAENAGRRETLAVLTRNGVDLVGLVAKEAHLGGADLEALNLSDAALNGADLRHANLKGADLTRADLTNAHLASADLTGAYLPYADLSEASLTRALLSNANLSRANLTNADLTNVDFDHAILCGTTMPDGSRCDRNCQPVLPFNRPPPPQFGRPGACPYLARK